MKKYISLMVFALALIGCQNSFDEYYSNEDSGVIATKSILTYLSEDPDYAYFVEVLKSSGVADTMDSRYLYTVFAPPADKLREAGIETMSADSVALYMKMHICANLKMTSVLDQYNRLQMFSNKYVDIKKDSVTLKYTADGVNMLETNIRCTDGIVYKLDDVLTPRLSIYEWLMAAGDDYSMFREALLARSRYTIDWDKTTIIGEDEQGRPIYDTVYSVSNDILTAGNIQDDKALYRFIIPTNDAINDAYDAMGDTYTVRGMSVAKADSTAWMNWILMSSTYDYSESGIESFDDIVGEADFSVFNKEFRPATVTMSEPLRLSNGFVQTIEKAYLPAYIAMSTVVMNPLTLRDYYRDNAPKGTTYPNIYNDYAGHEWWSQDIDTWIMGLDETNNLLGVGFGDQNFTAMIPYNYYFRTTSRTTATVDGEKIDKLTPRGVVPGNYSLSVALHPSNATDVASIYVNGELIEMVDSISQSKYTKVTKIGEEEYFYIGDSINPVTFCVSIWSPKLPPMNLTNPSAKYNSIKMGNFVLTPVNNY